MGVDLKTPYHYVREAGYEDIMDRVKEALHDDEWTTLPMQCTPKTLAAGAVYYVLKTNEDLPDKTQVEVSDDFNTSTMSVRNGYKHLAVYHGHLDADDVELPHE